MTTLESDEILELENEEEGVLVDERAGDDLKRDTCSDISLTNYVRFPIPRVNVEVMLFDTYISCPPNPVCPIPFETELFKGVVLVAIRTEPLDPLYESFFLGK